MPTTIPDQLGAQLAAAATDAHRRVMAAVAAAAADEPRPLSARELTALQADLRAAGMDPRAFQDFTSKARWARAWRANPDAAVDTAAETMATTAAEATAAEEKLANLRTVLREAEEQAANHRIAAQHAREEHDMAKRERSSSLERADQIERELRQVGFAGDLGERPPAPEQIRVRATAPVFIDNALREPGEVFLASADQIGGPVELVTDEMPLGKHPLRYRVRILRAFANTTGKFWPGDVVEIDYEHFAGDMFERVGDDVPLHRGLVDDPPEAPAPTPDVQPAPVAQEQPDEWVPDDDDQEGQ